MNVKSNTSKLLVILAIIFYGIVLSIQSASIASQNAATEVPQPVERWKVKKFGYGGNPQTWQKLQTDAKGGNADR